MEGDIEIKSLMNFRHKNPNNNSYSHIKSFYRPLNMTAEALEYHNDDMSKQSIEYKRNKKKGM